VYILPKATLDTVFKKGRDLLDLPSPAVSRRTRKIVISGPTREIVMEVGRTGWIFSTPSINRGPTEEGLTGFVQRIVNFTPEDVTVSVDPRTTGLDNPEHRILFQSDQSGMEIRFGGKAPGKTPRRFASIADAEGIFIVSETEIEALSPKLKELLDYRPFRVDRDAVRRIEATIEKERLTFERMKGWDCQWKGYPFAAIAVSLDSYLDFITGIQAFDVLNKFKVDKVDQQITFGLDDGSKIELELGKKDAISWVRWKGQVYQIDEQIYNKPDVKLAHVMDKILFRVRDDIESVGMKIDGTDKIMDKSRLPDFKVEELAGMDKRAESGIDASKTTMTVKVKTLKQSNDYTLVFGAAKGNLRYVWLKSSDGLILIKEELYQALIK